MTLSIIGTGRMGQALVRAWAQAGRAVVWGSRSPMRAKTLSVELGIEGMVKAASAEEAIHSAEIVLPALWHRDQVTWLQEHREQLAGKIIVNITNPFTVTFDDFTLEWGTSSAEELRKLVPEARWVGAFKNTFWDVFARPALEDGRVSDVYVTGDDASAKEAVLGLLEGLPFRALDGGALANNRTIERMTLFSRELAKRYGHYPHVSWTLWGESQSG